VTAPAREKLRPSWQKDWRRLAGLSTESRALARPVEPFSILPDLLAGPQPWRSQMAAIARVLSRVSGTDVGVEILKTMAMFRGVGLFVALLVATYGLDLSAGFF
jgi:hypothetical protein